MVKQIIFYVFGVLIVAVVLIFLKLLTSRLKLTPKDPTKILYHVHIKRKYWDYD